MKKRLAGITEKPSAMEAKSNMIELNRLDEADVRHDRCPVCKNKELNRIDGFKVCPRCDTNFKILDGKAYIIGEKGEMNKMENRIVARLKKMAEGEYAVDMDKLKAIPIPQIESLIKGCYTGDPFTMDENKACENIWEMIQDNFDIFTNDNSNQYLPMTPEIKSFIKQNDLLDAATTIS